MFQPEPGVYEKVHQIDFTSLYPSIIVKYNLSPETMEHPEMDWLSQQVLSSLLNLRIETKRLKKTNPKYKGIDSVLKWMLVTCFGYTGYRNAKFGQIQVHERITAISRELLMQIKELAENMGFEVLHGIVDCLWVIGEPISKYKEAVEKETGILTEVDTYDWIAFLPMSRWLRVIQPLLWQTEHWRDEDSRSNGPQGRHARVCAENAAGIVRGPGRGKEPGGASRGETKSAGGSRKVHAGA